MDRKEIVNSQEYKATKIALEWWYSLPEEQRKATDIDAEPDVIDAYEEGVLYGWNNPHWIPVEEELPKLTIDSWRSEDVFFATDDGKSHFGFYSNKGVWFSSVYGFNGHQVTHWMPLPEEPRKEE